MSAEILVCRLVSYIGLIIGHFCISDTCQSEELYSRGVIYKWPATLGGNAVTFTCPNNPAYSLSRECSIGGAWKDFDQEACGVLAEELNNLLTTEVSDHSIII